MFFAVYILYNSKRKKL